MKTADEYKKHSEECRKLARTALTPEERQQLIVMAETWEQLAQNRILMLKTLSLAAE
jgi:hypothetical protein